MAKVIFTINEKYFILDTETNTWEPSELAEKGTESRILDKVLNGEITKKES